jgi:nucleotide-binding universal stress UspA family protein
MMPALAEVVNRDCDAMVTRLSNDHRLDGIEHRRWVEQGEVAEIAGAFVREQHIDLLIVGTHGRGGVPRMLLGSVAQQMFHSVRCPVLAVGPRAPGTDGRLQLRRVLFSTDLSRESLAAVPWVLTAVREWHTELDVLHVCSSGKPAHRETMEHLRSELDRDINLDRAEGTDGVSPHCNVIAGKPAACVLDFAGRYREDLIVLGLESQRGLYDGPAWSHAYEIVRQASCPVLSVRAAQA